MITPSFGLTATERVLPRLALDWTTGIAQSGVDVTRAGVATFVGSNGLIQSASADTQRIDYSTGTAGLLVEESRTNLLTYSEDFSDASWVKDFIGVTANSTTAPDGLVSADIAIPSATSSNHFMYKSVTPTAVPHTQTVYAKAAGYNWVLLASFSVTAGLKSAWFDVANGVVGTVGAGVTAAITDAGNGWYRCSITYTPAAVATTIQFNPCDVDNRSGSWVANGTSGVYLYGAQLEAGAFATSYIPTEATAVTRNADVATMTGTNFSDWFNATEGTFLSQHDYLGFAPSDRITLMASTTPSSYAVNSIHIRTNNTTEATAIFNTTIQLGINFGGSVPNTTYKTALAYKLNNSGVSRNGSATNVDGTCTIPIVNALYIGTAGGTLTMNGHMQKILYWPQRLTNSEVQAFSKG